MNTMENTDFSKIRNALGRTQNQMAQILCVSPKAVQSFEQGWRKVPTKIEREMLLLLSLKSSVRSARACWEVKACPNKWRSNCIVWELQIGDFCWYFSGTLCQGQVKKSWNEKIKLCRQCEVYQSMFLTS